MDTSTFGGNAARIAVLVGLLVLFGWVLPEHHVIDYRQDLWSKPGRVWALGAALAVTIGGTFFAGRRSGGEPFRMAPLLAAGLIAGGLAYGFDLRGHVLPASAEPKCKAHHSVNLDGVCAPTRKAAPHG